MVDPGSKKRPNWLDFRHSYSPAAKRRDLSPQERGEVENLSSSWKRLDLRSDEHCKAFYWSKAHGQHLAPLLRGEVAALRRG
jgi:hypothetical protein